MLRLKYLIVVSVVAAGQLGLATTAEAGPLLDWLFHRNRCCAPAVTACAPPVQPMTCQTTCQQTCSRVVVNYVPHTAYRCEWERVPVTTYQQTSSTDPCTGCTVTCNRPCTSWSWRMKQVPYTTYRPVYHQETYQVPVTYTTQVAAPASPCTSCASGYAPATAYYAASTPYVAPATTVSPYYQTAPVVTSPTYQTAPVGGTTEADLQPSLLSPVPQSTPQPAIIENPPVNNSSSTWPAPYSAQPTGAAIRPLQDPNPAARWDSDAAPQLLNPFNQTTSNTPSVQPWDYSPVRTASYEVPVQDSADRIPAALAPSTQTQTVAPSQPQEYNGSWTVEPKQGPRVNEGWRND